MDYDDLCDKCEEWMQPYLDRTLDESERVEAEQHLAACPPCERRYKFEEGLRRYVRHACSDQIPFELKEKLAALHTSL